MDQKGRDRSIKEKQRKGKQLKCKNSGTAFLPSMHAPYSSLHVRVPWFECYIELQTEHNK